MRENRQSVAWHQNALQVPCTKSPDIFPNLHKNHIKYHFSITKREKWKHKQELCNYLEDQITIFVETLMGGQKHIFQSQCTSNE